MQEIWPADTAPVEGNKDALDSAFLPGDEPDMQDVMVHMHASSLAPARATPELVCKRSCLFRMWRIRSCDASFPYASEGGHHSRP